MSADPPKRFYKEAGIFDDAAGFGIALDGKAVKTPGGGDFRAPTRALAKACASEWAAQGDRIQPRTMPLTQFSFAAIDHTPGRREALLAHVAKYGETDLCCHRAETPAALAARQAAAWDPLLAWARADLGLNLPVVIGLLAAKVDAEAIAVLRATANAFDDFRLTALAHTTDLAGSALIGLAVAHGRFDSAQAWDASTVDDAWSLDQWGEDAQARARLEAMRAEFDTIAQFVAALG